MLSDIDHLTFRSDISNDPSVNIAINITQITVNSIKATFTADNSDATFLFGLIEKAEFDKLGNDKAFLEYELGRLNSEVANDPWSNTLEEYLDFLLGWWDPADQVLNRDNLKADTDYYIYAYGINTKGEFTTGLFKQLVHTAGLIDIAFNLQASGITSTTATITARPDNDDTYYYLGFITKMNLTMNSMAMKSMLSTMLSLQCAWLHQGAPHSTRYRQYIKATVCCNSPA